MIRKIDEFIDQLSPETQEKLKFLKPYEIDNRTMDIIKKYYEDAIINKNLCEILACYITYSEEICYEDNYKQKIANDVSALKESINFNFLEFVKLHNGSKLWKLDLKDCKIVSYEIINSEDWLQGFYLYGSLKSTNFLCRFPSEYGKNHYYDLEEKLLK